MVGVMNSTGSLPQPFDRRALRRHRDRAAAGLAGYDFLFREVAERLADRLDDLRRTFPLALDLGCRHGRLAEALAPAGAALPGREGGARVRGGIETLVQCDLSPTMAGHAAEREPASPAEPRRLVLAADEEALPFGPGRFDLVISCLSLQWANDLPGVLAQIRWSLKPDGLFLCALFGGDTLTALRRALFEGESAVRGGVSPRVSPFVDLRDAGGLLQRAGFALPVADADRIVVDWGSPLSLMRDLSRMGEGNALAERPRHLTSPATLLAAAERYPRRDDGRVEAEFEVVYLTGWAPADNQQKPLRPGSAKASLADALGGEEVNPLPP